MEVLGTLSGGAPVIKQFFASAAMTTAGIPVEGADVATADIGGVAAVNASAVSGKVVGITLDTAPDAAATGITSASDILVSVVVNPDVIARIKMSGGTTSDTALTLTATTAADSTGVTATGTTTLDDSMIWGYDGGNAGILRRADDTAGSVSINFPNAIGSGDNFLTAVGFPGWAHTTANLAYFDLTTTLDQAVAQTAATDTDLFQVIDVEARDEADEGRTNSFYHCIVNDHLFGGNAQSS